MEFFDRCFHIPLPIVTKHELGLPFPPRNLPRKFSTNSSTILLVIVVTDRHTIPTPVKTFPRFHGDNQCLGVTVEINVLSVFDEMLVKMWQMWHHQEGCSRCRLTGHGKWAVTKQWMVTIATVTVFVPCDLDQTFWPLGQCMPSDCYRVYV